MKLTCPWCFWDSPWTQEYLWLRIRNSLKHPNRQQGRHCWNAGSTMTLFSVILWPGNSAETARRRNLMLCYRTPHISAAESFAMFQPLDYEIVLHTANSKHSIHPFSHELVHSANNILRVYAMSSTVPGAGVRAQNRTDKAPIFQEMRRVSMVMTRETTRHLKEIKQ